MDPYRIAILGLGTVGTEVVALLTSGRLRSLPTGRAIEIVGIGVRDPARPRELPAGLARRVTGDIAALATRHDVDLVVELIGGVDAAGRAIRAAIEAGKDVVTANKAVLAERGDELFELASTRGRRVLCEAAVAGAIPILQVLQSSLQSSRVQTLTAILNGTSNYVLGQLQLGMQPIDAIAAAQRAGFAESDPTLDLDGTDAAHKLALLARVLTGRRVDFRRVARSGIVGLTHADLAFGTRRSWALRLLARFEARSEGRAALGVYPAWVRADSPMASARDEQNAVLLTGHPFGSLFLSGKGAGGGPTASGVVADILRAAKGEGQVERCLGDLEIDDPNAGRARHYVRLEVPDRPGVLGRIASALGRHDVSISSVEQPETMPTAPARVHLLTHHVPRDRLDAALADVSQDASLRIEEPARGPFLGHAPVCVRVAIEPEDPP